MGRGEVRIRSARLEDGDALFGLVEQFAMSYRPERAAFDRHFPLLVRGEQADVVAGEMDGRVVGYALAFHLPTLYANGVVTELQELMVGPEYRDRGIGRRLVGEVVARARAVGAVEVTVPTRRAGPYYRRLGFEETAAYFKLKLTESNN